jgi:hypothetical protein
VVNSLLTRNTQVNHTDIVQHITAVNRIFEHPTIAQFWNPLTAAIDAVVTQQAQIIAYIDDYKLLMIATLVVIPLLVVFKRPSGDGGGHTVVAEKTLSYRAALLGEPRYPRHARATRRSRHTVEIELANANYAAVGCAATVTDVEFSVGSIKLVEARSDLSGTDAAVIPVRANSSRRK